jgi:hypothetical protein
MERLEDRFERTQASNEGRFASLEHSLRDQRSTRARQLW